MLCKMLDEVCVLECSSAGIIPAVQVESLEVSPVLAGEELHQLWLQRLPDSSTVAKAAAGRRSAQHARCYMRPVLQPGDAQPAVTSATAEAQQAFTDLVQLYHAHDEARAGQYGMFLLTADQASTGCL